MASPVDLGTAVLCILDSNSSLILNSSPEVKFDSETVEFKEAESSLQLLQSRDTWVTPAPEMNLYIDISADPCLDQTLEFFSQAGELLRSSRTWSDLGLTVLFKSCDHVHDEINSSIRLSFGLRKTAVQSTNTKRSRLPASIKCSHEAAPPIGIPTACLSTIYVPLEYKPKDVHKCKQMPYTAPSVGSCNNSQDTLVGSPCPPQILYFPSVITIDSICDKNSVAAFVEELQEIDEDCEFQPLPLPNDSDYDSPNIGEFNQLLDLSIRNLITPAPVGSISAIQKDLSTHLSELAPSIFSLGYSEAMDQRAQFIPSIAKSLSSIIGRSKSPVLHQRVSDLIHKTQSDQSPEQNTANLRTIVKTSLWRIAQKQLYNPSASRKISSLASTFIAKEELLDYITDTEGDRRNETNTMIPNGDQYLGTDEGCMFSETEDSTLTCVEEDPRDRSYDDSEDSDILDIDPDPLPDTSLTSSYSPQAVSSHPRRNYPSESEMLTDSLNEDVLSLIVDDGDVSGESVDMLCE